jgi:hypothetical protein
MFIKEDFYQSDPDIMAHIMTQVSLKGSLKLWGNKAYALVMSEIKQLHFWKTFKPKHWNELSKTQNLTMLESHMFLKEKRDGSLKGRLWPEEKQTVRLHFQGRCKFANHHHRSHTTIMHHQCQGRKGCHCH